MISKKDYQRMKYLQKNDAETYNMIKRMNDSYSAELSAASHYIKNYISFIRSSYQIISEHHPEVTSYDFWNEMHGAMDDLNNFMDQTSLYRYCGKTQLTNTNLNNLLFELPDELDSIFETEDRDYSFDIDVNEINISADYNKLKTALIEILKNSYEATTENDTIQITAHKTSANSQVKVTISNQGIIESKMSEESFDFNDYRSKSEDISEQDKKNTSFSSDETYEICKPFYSTKSEHAGIGLAIVYKICLTHNADLEIVQNGPSTEISITFPLAS